MMKINFNGYVRGKNRATIREAAQFFLQELLGSRKAGNTQLDLRFRKLRCGASGYCQIHDDEDNNYSPKMFTIDINGNLSIKEMLETLAHEMVHLRQFRNKELGYRENYTLYRGTAYRIDLPYDKEPWEKEAYKLEKVLVEKFVAFMQQGE